MRFIAIDFETANETRGSACAIGLAWVEEGRIVKTADRLIRPRPMRFEPMNVAIHGITASMVRDAQSFPEVLEEFKGDLCTSIVVAHNAAFDMSVMRATLDSFGLSYPAFPYLCSAKLASMAWPQLGTSRLDVVAAMLGIRFNHHQAEADAIACAMVTLEAAKVLGAAALENIPERCAVTFGQMRTDGYSPCSAPRGSVQRVRELVPNFVLADDDNPLRGKRVAFTGTLTLMERREAAQFVVDAGGQPQEGVRRDTDYLVCGPSEIAALAAGQATTKLAKAIKAIEKGALTEIIGEDDFYKMLGAKSETALTT